MSPLRPSARAILLAVPIGRIAKAISRLRSRRATLATVPSPPATITRSHRFRRVCSVVILARLVFGAKTSDFQLAHQLVGIGMRSAGGRIVKQ